MDSMIPSPEVTLSERLKRLGFSNSSRMRLYGQEFDLLSDPIIAKDEDNAVFIEVIEIKSRQSRRVRIPLTIVNMAASDGKVA